LRKSASLWARRTTTKPEHEFLAIKKAPLTELTPNSWTV